LVPQIRYDLPSGIGFVNYAAGGWTLQQILADFQARAVPLLRKAKGKVVVFILDGTNSYGLLGNSGAQVYAATCAIADAARQTGADVSVIATTTPTRHWLGVPGFPADPPDINDRIAAGNALLMLDPDQKLDAVVDVAGILSARSLEPNDWTTDGVHLASDAADVIEKPIAATMNWHLVSTVT
jgi:hypothetical protein